MSVTGRVDVTLRANGELAGPLDRALHLLLPAPCLGCGAPLGARPPAISLCRACRGELKRPATPACALCAEPLLAAAPPAGFRCGRCRAQPPAFERLVAAWRYEAPLDAAIRAFKFSRREGIGRGLAADLGAALEATGDDRAEVRAEVVVPVPLHWRRRLIRGYDQAEHIARPLARRLGIPFRRALRRVRATRRQTRLGGSARRRNPLGAFAVTRRAAGDIHGWRILLVDDVATTGATLDAAARCLLDRGAATVVAAAAALASPPARTPSACDPSTRNSPHPQAVARRSTGSPRELFGPGERILRQGEPSVPRRPAPALPSDAGADVRFEISDVPERALDSFDSPPRRAYTDG